MKRLFLIATVLGGLAARPAASAAEELTLRWEAIPGAMTYELEIATDREFSTTVEKQVVAATRAKWTPPAARPYWWRVRAVDANGRPGEFSAPGITGAAPAAPVLRSPDEGMRFSAGKDRVPLRWGAAEGVARYRIEVAKDAAFGKVVASGEVVVPEWAFERPRTGTWHWRVIAIDLANRESAPSKSRVFKVSKAGAAVAPSPVASATPGSAAAPALVVAGGARLGVFHNLGEITAPLPALEISVQRARVRAALQAGHYAARTSAADGGVTLRSSLGATPVAVTATFEQPIAGGAGYAGGGLSITMFDGAVAAPGQPIQRSRDVAPGAHLLAGWERPVGRTFAVSAEVAWSLGPRTEGLVEASASGVSLSVGIRVPFSGRRRP